MLSFFVAGFAVAGLLAATGPILIHLFNRRRYRVVEWAAMDFLREAMRRNRKVLQIRDLLILALRVLCVLGFGFALARPFLMSGNASLWPLFGVGLAILVALGAAVAAIAGKNRNARQIATGISAVMAFLALWGGYQVIQTGENAAATVASRAPVHAVLLLDNSLSMGYEALNGTLLDQAKAKASDFIEQLPPESRISVIPLCGSESAFTLDGYRNREDALDALRRIQVVNLGGSAASASRAIELAAQACSKVPELTAKRVVLLGDQQAINWPAGGLQQALSTIPELQIVQIGPDAAAENLAVTEFRVRDGIADVETPSSFLTTVTYQGREPLANVLVTLTVDGAVVASQTVEMQPDQERQIEFKHQFDVSVDPGQPAFVPATVSIECDSVEGDRLPLDNQRHLAVPVVAGIPVVFVDQFGAEEEDAEKNRLGDTYALRRWLAPRMSRDDLRRQLIRIRHTSIDRLEQQHLEDARLVVIAGVASPGEKVGLLRQFVQQGGRLVIAPGGAFDTNAWNDNAWRNGAGILPVPLKTSPLGETPEEASRKQTLDPFFLSFSTLVHDYFQIEGESRSFLEDFYKSVFFFKAVEADSSAETLQKMVTAEAERITADRAFIEAADKRSEEWTGMEQKGTFGPTEQAQRAEDDERRRMIQPQWLLWRDVANAAAAGAEQKEAPTELAEQSLPRFLGRFTKNDAPFLVERNIGAGRVLFVASAIFSRGSLSDWNNLTKDNPVLLFDRIIRTQLEETLPARNFDSGERITLPVGRGEQLRYTLSRPAPNTMSRMASAATRTDTTAASPLSSPVSEVALTEIDPIAPREESLPVEALGPERFGVSVRNPYRSGHYVVTARRLLMEGSAAATPTSLRAGSADSQESDSPGEKQRELVLAVNGPAAESDLRPLGSRELKERLGTANYRWIDRDDQIALEGAQVRGRDLWKWLGGFALAGLLLEMLVLSWPQILGASPAAAPVGGSGFAMPAGRGPGHRGGNS